VNKQTDEQLYLIPS